MAMVAVQFAPLSKPPSLALRSPRQRPSSPLLLLRLVTKTTFAHLLSPESRLSNPSTNSATTVASFPVCRAFDAIRDQRGRRASAQTRARTLERGYVQPTGHSLPFRDGANMRTPTERGEERRGEERRGETGPDRSRAHPAPLLGPAGGWSDGQMRKQRVAVSEHTAARESEKERKKQTKANRNGCKSARRSCGCSLAPTLLFFPYPLSLSR